MPQPLEGKVAIVTGAGRGLGRVMTLGLLQAGARVAATELDAEALDGFGRLDILLNNAGINMSLFRRPDVKNLGKFWEVTPQEFRRIVEVNVIAAFLMARAALPSMLKQNWGRIINVTTSLDTMYRGGMQPYGGTKAANEA